jgi:hypothetical protein
MLTTRLVVSHLKSVVHIKWYTWLRVLTTTGLVIVWFSALITLGDVITILKSSWHLSWSLPWGKL